MTAIFYDIYLFSISTLFKILEWATSSYVGPVLKKMCQKCATVDKGLGQPVYELKASKIRWLFIEVKASYEITLQHGINERKGEMSRLRLACGVAK